MKQLTIGAVILLIVSTCAEGRHIRPMHSSDIELTAHDVKRLEELLEFYHDREEFKVVSYSLII